MGDGAINLIDEICFLFVLEWPLCLIFFVFLGGVAKFLCHVSWLFFIGVHHLKVNLIKSRLFFSKNSRKNIFLFRRKLLFLYGGLICSELLAMKSISFDQSGSPRGFDRPAPTNGIKRPSCRRSFKVVDTFKSNIVHPPDYVTRMYK